MTLTAIERDLLNKRDTALNAQERTLLSLVFQDLAYRAREGGMILKGDDSAAKLEAAFVRYLLDSKGVDTSIAENGFPALDIDKQLWKGKPLHLRAKNERKVVYGLLNHIAAAGFAIERVYNGEEDEYVANAKAAMELVFNLDGCHLWFKKEGFNAHYVQIVLGNAEDGSEVIADWNYTVADPDGFNALMEAFKPENFI